MMGQIKPLALHPPHATPVAAADGGCVPTAESTGQAWILPSVGEGRIHIGLLPHKRNVKGYSLCKLNF